MPITAIINGYYRSGTTLLWNIARENFPGHLCCYEPLHPKLSQLLEEAKHRTTPWPGHDLPVFAPYFELPPDVLQRLIARHPNTGWHGIRSEQALFAYFDILHNLPRPVILQPNRLHFFLRPSGRHYHCRIVHIIRHPASVYTSLLRASFARNLAQKIKEQFVRRLDPFGVTREYLWIVKNADRLWPARPGRLARLGTSLSPFAKFVVVWTLSNYHALEQLQEGDGLVLLYEEFLRQPQKTTTIMLNHLGAKQFRIPAIEQEKSPDHTVLRAIVDKIRQLGLTEKFEAILALAESRGISYTQTDSHHSSGTDGRSRRS